MKKKPKLPTPEELANVVWVHPDRSDDGRAAMKRIGVDVGDEFFHATVAGWINNTTYRTKGDGLWEQGRLVVHSAMRYRLIGWYTPQDGDSDKGGVLVEHGMHNVVIGTLRTGNIIGDPILTFPIAKAKASSRGKGK